MGRWGAKFVEGAFYRTLVAVAVLCRWTPTPLLLAGAWVMGNVVYVFDRRGRRAGRQNTDIVYGDTMTPREKRNIVRASIRGAVRSILILLHAAPMTAERIGRWVDIPEELGTVLREGAKQAHGAIVVSGHVGNWEVLLGLASVFRDIGDTTFLVEASVHPAVDRFLAYLRGSGGGSSASRQGGARALNSHVRRGGIAGLLIDRNVRRNQGGIWAPFFGLQARTTPLPAFLARRNDAPIAPIFCIPTKHGRYRIELLPELSKDVRTDDQEADILEITTRLNGLVEQVILEHPEAWNWTLKRWKSRPTKEQGAYPPYSLFDPPG